MNKEQHKSIPSWFSKFSTLPLQKATFLFYLSTFTKHPISYSLFYNTFYQNIIKYFFFIIFFQQFQNQIFYNIFSTIPESPATQHTPRPTLENLHHQHTPCPTVKNLQTHHKFKQSNTNLQSITPATTELTNKIKKKTPNL